MSLPSLGSSSPAQKQRNQQLALAVFFLRRLPWARPRSSSFGFGASLSLPSCRSRAESPWILVVKDYKVRLLIAVSLVCSDCNEIGNQEQQSGGMLTGLHSPV
ncbi:uncharacterized protein LOC107459870 isoform X5 [Arachis duranensis]|uniref:Uncharacterized protein LOC107459870 isoform X5 n=1 Tax=Arachis duranensis TaxID=130453 RepID=A0A9C6WAU5_ARADU|nr:uncharacterized protein LOC107459870 isoform X5 [Arachis duranensis]